MDPAKLREYVDGYDRRKAARLAEQRRLAEEAKAKAPALAAICRAYGATRVRLFGSLVHGFYGETPDIDLAIEGVPPGKYFSLWIALDTAALPTEVDLVDMGDALPSLRRKIESQAVDL